MNTQSELESRNTTLNYIAPKWQLDPCITDVSTKSSIENEGGGILQNLKNGAKKTQSFSTGKFTSNFRAEVVALRTAAEMLLTEIERKA